MVLFLVTQIRLLNITITEIPENFKKDVLEMLDGSLNQTAK